MKKIAIALLLTVFIAGNAFAQLDPDDDGIGVYFDPCACVNCLDLEVGQHLGYVVITHPTSTEGVGGWEAKIWNTGNAIVTYDLFGDAINFATRENEFVVGLGTPVINPYMFPAVVVAFVNLYIMDTETPVEFFIDHIFFNSIDDVYQPVYIDGGDPTVLKPLQQIQGSAELPVAIINGSCEGTVAIELETFDSLKALYR